MATSVVWFDDPSQLWDKTKLLEFWPTSNQNPADRINAASRIVIYLSILVFIIQKDARALVLGAATLGVIWAFHHSGTMVAQEKYEAPACSGSSKNNPMGNVLLTDYADNANKPATCYYPYIKDSVKQNLDDTFPRDAADIYGSRNQAVRAFYTMPNTQIPNDQTGFAEACYGKKFAPMCRDDPTMCSAENNPRMPEGVQQRMYSNPAFF